MSDPWLALRATTRARIGLGRTGDALPISEILDFQLAHARARDAVHTPLDTASVAASVAPLPSITVRSRAADRDQYLRRPDLGRQLDPDCHLPAGPFDAAFVIADGLSPIAVQVQAAPLVKACIARLPHWSIAPVVIATQARVALGDGIGAALKARIVAVLIGERPGLSVANSMGIYLTWQPRIGRSDAERNCISNIHADGMSTEAAADMLAWLMNEACVRKLSGVNLKDDRVAATRAFPER